MTRAKKMYCIIAYDVNSDKKRVKVAKILEKHGARINLSVFECMFTQLQYSIVKQEIRKLINPQKDTIIYYPICMTCFTKIVYQPERRQVINSVKFI